MFGTLAGLAGLASKIGQPLGGQPEQPNTTPSTQTGIDSKAAAAESSTLSKSGLAKQEDPAALPSTTQESKQFPPPLNSLFSMDLPGLKSQTTPESATAEEHAKPSQPAKSVQLLSALESSANNYLQELNQKDLNKHDDQGV